MSIQYVNQSKSLYLDHFPICQEANVVSKESTCTDNMKLKTGENCTSIYQTRVTEMVKDMYNCISDHEES
jgi:hypothetical protein